MGDAKNSKSKLNATIVKLGLVSFFADVASEMLYPVTPIFLTSVLGVSMASLGLIEGVAESIASLMKVWSGGWSDQIQKRKPFIVLGYFLGAVSKPLIGLSRVWSDVLFARSIDRFGKGIRSAPRDALISESVSLEHRGAAFGWHRAMDTAGAAIGPLFSIALLSLFAVQMRDLYFYALIPGLVSVLLIFWVREKTHRSPNLSKVHKIFSWSTWNQLSPDFKHYLFSWSLFAIANSSDVFLLMRAKQSGFTTESVILLFCAYNLTYAVSSPKLGQLSDRVDRRKLLIAGLFIFALVYLGFAYANRPWHFWTLFLIYGTYMGATDGVGKALAVDLSPKELKGTALGLLGTVSGCCTILASAVGGLLWDHGGSTLTFLYGAAGALMGGVALLVAVKSRPVRVN